MEYRRFSVMSGYATSFYPHKHLFQGILWVESYAGIAFADLFKFLRLVFYIQLFLASVWFFGIALPTVAGHHIIKDDINARQAQLHPDISYPRVTEIRL